jgi:hypothetical protein
VRVTAAVSAVQAATPARRCHDRRAHQCSGPSRNAAPRTLAPTSAPVVMGRTSPLTAPAPAAAATNGYNGVAERPRQRGISTPT